MLHGSAFTADDPEVVHYVMAKRPPTELPSIAQGERLHHGTRHRQY